MLYIPPCIVILREIECGEVVSGLAPYGCQAIGNNVVYYETGEWEHGEFAGRSDAKRTSRFGKTETQLNSLMQDCDNYISNRLGLLQFCTKPLNCPISLCYWHERKKCSFLWIGLDRLWILLCAFLRQPAWFSVVLHGDVFSFRNKQKKRKMWRPVPTWLPRVDAGQWM